MPTDGDDVRDALPQAPSATVTVARLVAGVGGVLAIVLVSLFTLGGALLGACGVGLAAARARRLGVATTRRGSWLGAVATVGISLLVGGGIAVTRLPDGTLAQFRQTMDSASASTSTTTPAWLERVAPGTTARVSKSQEPAWWQGPVTAWATVIGVVLVWAIFAGLIGTVSWLATMPLVYGLTGSWFPPAPPSPRAV